MKRVKKIYDITLTLGVESVAYPGDPPYERKVVAALEAGASCNLSALRLSAHSGTHLDFPAHFIASGQTLDQYPAASFILPARVISIQDRSAVRPAELTRLRLRKGEAVLFKTRNSRRGLAAAGRYTERYVHLSPEAADFLVRKKVALVGIDYVSIDRALDPDHPAHHILLGAGVLILEAINLRRVLDGRYTLICLPLKMPGAEASPVRAVLR